MTYFPGRTEYLGASDVGAALGLSPYVDPHQLWLRKTGRAGDPAQSGPMERGRDMENLIIDLCVSQYGMSIKDRQREYTIVGSALKYDPKWGEWLRCHVDGIIADAGTKMHRPDSVKGDGVLEVKAPGPQMLRKYIEEGLPKDYIVQMQCALYLTGMTWGRYAFIDYEAWELHCFDVIRSESIITPMLINLMEFWRHVVDDKPVGEVIPPSVPQTKGLLVRRQDSEIEALCEEYADAVRLHKQAKVRLDEAKEQIKEKAGEENELVELANLLRVSHKYTKPKPKVDTEALLEWAATLTSALLNADTARANKMAENFNPDMFTTPGKPSRPLRITGIGDFKGVV
jgi:predicted phage-related endonuclease